MGAGWDLSQWCIRDIVDRWVVGTGEIEEMLEIWGELCAFWDSF